MATLIERGSASSVQLFLLAVDRTARQLLDAEAQDTDVDFVHHAENRLLFPKI